MYEYIVFKSSFAQPKTEAFGIRFIAHRIYTLKGGVGGEGSSLFLKSPICDGVQSMSSQIS